MASGVQSVRLCLRAFRHPPTPRKVAPRIPPIYVPARALSSTPIRWSRASKREEDELEEDEEDDGSVSVAEMERSLRAALRDPEFEASTRIQEQMLNNANAIMSNAQRVPKLKRPFWHDEEEDTDLITDERNEDEFDEDDIMSMAHGKLEEYREQREYARIAAWEMPLLSKLARPFEPPTAQEPLRFRYTSYMGEFHPAENKVVLEFSPKDMPLDEAQQLKLKKLLGPRYNPETDIAKMSCEQFEHQAQNKRYLGDLVESLIARAKDPSDMFEDIPLDTRHHPIKIKPKFPREWRMTEERMKFLEETRQKSLLLDQTKEEAGALIDGKEKIEQFFDVPKPQVRVPEYARAQLNEFSPLGRIAQPRRV
ncbi:mitochondrial ribosomal protein [Daldinia vernicosa]|uniref:mitochondrial ribosomal protein n=1 Tax=Daldinia vernicosa TaxID=114800 RepID=UPI0020085947|nr:mitochondrial ribosomal protein [Daldinia vernicosa]KAI0851344.1 mitochondrial ribosomal protein [Daldinia vernicosa]